MLGAGMREWSRREVLSALGWVAAAPVLAAACGGDGKRARKAGAADLEDVGALRGRLRALVDDLERRYPAAWARVDLQRTGTAAVDAAERSTALDARATAVVAVFDGRRWFERATTEIGEAGLEAAAQALGVSVPARGRPRGDRPRRRQDMPARVKIDPFSGPASRWLEPLEALFERARKLGGSRMVYRGAFVSVDETRSVFVGDGRDLTQRIVRTRGGVLFVAVTGPSPSAEEVSRSGTAGLELLSVDGAELATGAERTLALTTARPPSTGEIEVVLAAPVAALIAARCIAPAFEAHRWQSGESRVAALVGQQIGSELLTAIDDPTLAGGYGSYAFDDEGWLARPTALIERGIVRGALTCRDSARALQLARTGHARRTAALGPVAPSASNLVIAAGDRTLEDLIGSVKQGLLIETAHGASADPGSLRMAVRAPRGREIVDGRLTGRTYAQVDLVGELPAVLGSVRGASSTTASIALTSPVAMSASAPALLARARIAERGR